MISENVSIVNHQDCFGCSACMAICPVDAVHMSCESNGFLYPLIKENECIHCGLCVRACPSINYWTNDLTVSEITAYGAFAQRFDRRNCSSGGVFPELAKTIVQRGGDVSGCIVGDDLSINHVLTNDLGIISKMSDSKYVQSNLKNCFREIANSLSKGKTVLFSGTSCQTHGLIGYLSSCKSDKSKLLCVDLICHGVPSPALFKKYLDFYQKNTMRTITGIRFRSKKYGWGDNIGIGNYIQSINTDSGRDQNSFLSQLWVNVFSSNYSLRPCCFHCPYTSINKPGDITLGDFWGIDRVLEGFSDNKGTSLALIRSAQGESALLDSTITIKKVTDLKIATMKQARLKTPCEKPSEYDQFWNDFKKNDFSLLAKKYFRFNKINRIKYRIKKAFLDLGLIYVGNRVFNDIYL